MQLVKIDVVKVKIDRINRVLCHVQKSFHSYLSIIFCPPLDPRTTCRRSKSPIDRFRPVMHVHVRTKMGRSGFSDDLFYQHHHHNHAMRRRKFFFAECKKTAASFVILVAFFCFGLCFLLERPFLSLGFNSD